MTSDYRLLIIFRDRAIVRFAGSDLERTRRDAMDLAADYLRTHPADAQAHDLSFQVVDEAGRLLLVLPADAVASRARVATTFGLEHYASSAAGADPNRLRSEPDLVSAGP